MRQFARKRWRKALGPVVALAMLAPAGCQLTPDAGRLLPGGLQPFPPAESLAGLSLLQKVEIHTPAGTTHHRLLMTVSEREVTLVVFGQMGQRAATFRYNGTDFEAEALIPYELPLPAERLMTILQIVVWPVPALERHLSAERWSISHHPTGRRLRDNGEVIATVDYSGGDPPAGESVYRARDGYYIVIQSVRH